MTRPAASADVVRFQVSPPPKTELFSSLPSAFAISPDGRTLAFTTGVIASERQLWIRSLGSTTARLVPGAERPAAITWSPDSQSIVYTLVGGGGMGPLKRVDLRSGAAITLTDAGVAGAWSAKGDVLFRGGDGRLYQIAASGGTARPVTELDKTLGEVAHHAAFFLRDGRRFVFQAQSSDLSKSAVYLSSLDSVGRVKLLDGLTGARAESGFLLYRRESAVLAQPFDEDSGRLTGEPKPMIEGVEYNTATGSAYFSVSETGALVYRASNSAAMSTLTWLDDRGRPVGRIALEGDYTSTMRPSLSNDGRRLAVSRREGQGRSDIWVIDIDRDVPSKFTNSPEDEDSPIFTADGSRIVYRSSRNAQHLYQKGSGGAGAEELLNDSEGAKRPTGLSPNGDVLLLSVGARGRSNEIWGLSMKDLSKPFTLVGTGFNAGMAVFSPNGRWFAYCEGDSGADQVYVQPYPTNGKRWRISPESGSSPQWSADGKAVYFTRTDNHVMRVEVTEAGGELRPGVAEELFLAPGTFEHRGVLRDWTRNRFLVPVPRDQITAALDIVLNWPALLRSN
jgi:Tol biopolymer transport system component